MTLPSEAPAHPPPPPLNKNSQKKINLMYRLDKNNDNASFT